MSFPVMAFKVEEESMEPNIQRGQYVIARSIFGKPRKGDVVILKHPKNGMKLIKRISEIRDGKYFVLGDNSDFSEDSRTFGPVERNMIIGKIFL